MTYLTANAHVSVFIASTVTEYIMKIAVILACLCAVTLAHQSDWEFDMWTSGRRSTREDDAPAQAVCPRGYHIKSCHWSVYESDYAKNFLPDGVKIVDRSDGYYCEAYNQAWGKGVVSSAHCIKALISVYSDDRPGDYELRQPIATCPPGYRLLPGGCSLHSDIHHQHPLAAALSDGDSCFTSADCLSCKVHARCMLDSESFTRERPFPPPVAGKLTYIGIVETAA